MKDDAKYVTDHTQTEMPADGSGAQAFSAAPSRVVEKTLEEAPADGAALSVAKSAGADTAKKDKEKEKKKSSLKSFFGFKEKDKGEKGEKDKFVGGIVLDRPEPEKPDGDEVTRSDPKEAEAKASALRSEIEKLRVKVPRPPAHSPTHTPGARIELCAVSPSALPLPKLLPPPPSLLPPPPSIPKYIYM